MFGAVALLAKICKNVVKFLRAIKSDSLISLLFMYIRDKLLHSRLFRFFSFLCKVAYKFIKHRAENYVQLIVYLCFSFYTLSQL